MNNWAGGWVGGRGLLENVMDSLSTQGGYSEGKKEGYWGRSFLNKRCICEREGGRERGGE